VDHARRTLLSATLGTLTVLVAFTAPLANLNQTAAGLGMPGIWVPAGT